MSMMDKDVLKVLYTEEEIARRVQELGAEMYDELKDKNPIFVSVLRGAFIFMADIVRACQVPCDVEFISVSSYGNGTFSTGAVHITRDIHQDITGRHLVVIEDILDSGNTLAFLKNYFMAKGAASVTICTLLDQGHHRRLHRLCGARRIRGGLRPGLRPEVPQSALYRCAQARGLRRLSGSVL